jgi:hypothetical protein
MLWHDPGILLSPVGPRWSAVDRGGVAQQVRALPCHGRGRGFESRRSRFCCPSIPIVFWAFRPGLLHGREVGTVEKHTYDEADRLIDAGPTNNAFGDVTALSAANANGVWAWLRRMFSASLGAQARVTTGPLLVRGERELGIAETLRCQGKARCRALRFGCRAGTFSWSRAGQVFAQ